MAPHAKNKPPRKSRSRNTRDTALNEAAAAGRMDRAMGWAETAMEVPNTLANFIFIPATLGGSFVKWLGGKTNVRAVEKAGHAIGTPTDFINRSFGYFGGKLGVGSAVPKVIADAPMGVTVWNASFVGGSSLAMFGVARSFSEHLASLKQMYADMTGKDVRKISNATVLTGKVPAAVADARSLLMKSSGLQGVAQTAGLLVSIKQLLNRHIDPKAFFAQMGLVLGAPLVISLMGESILPAYKNLSDAHKHGEQIPVDTYAQFILTANKDLKERGASGKDLAEKLAEHYAAAKAAPATILKDIENGQMMQRIKSLVGNGEVRLEPSKPEPGKHADAASDRQEQPVVGPETAKVVNRREAAEPSPALGA